MSRKKTSPRVTRCSRKKTKPSSPEYGEIEQYDIVEVIRLTRPTRGTWGSPSVNRQPKVGDVGTVVEKWVAPPSSPGCYLVECVDKNGLTLWLSDFEEDELRRRDR